jgi:hypothetical protein
MGKVDPAEHRLACGVDRNVQELDVFQARRASQQLVYFLGAGPGLSENESAQLR